MTGSYRIRCEHRRDLCESGGHVEIHKAVFQFRHGRAVFVPRAGIDGEDGQHAPVVGGIRVVNRLTEILVGVAEGDGACIRNADEKVGNI